MSYGRAGKELRLFSAHPEPAGLQLEIEVLGKRHEIRVAVTGPFQAGNILCALGLVLGTGTGNALDFLPALASVRGRMELAGTTPKSAGIYVDYAHTPDALETVLKALRAHTTSRLHVVFGCGGNRDKGKRPQMGAIAARLADVVYVTDDNPRHEDPSGIRREILSACPQGIEVDDRAKAVHMAIHALERGDTLVIAGKGHEQGQIVGNDVRPFDDVMVARAALKEL
jgi:UDP-N-acetylmuramoyl-L-alanyl-D-glutamate--2,6-diaminopimelate ligase